MWPVVVLGLITAVLAWVWFGSRGKESSEDTVQERGDTGLGTHLTPLQEEPESEDTQPQKTPHSGSVLSLGPHTTIKQDKGLSTTGRDEGYGQGETFLHEDLVQDHKDGGQLTAPHIRQDPPQQSKTEVHQSTGVEQVHEDLSPSGDTTVEEQVHEALSPSGDTRVEEQVHEALSPSGDTTVEEQVHEDLSPSGNTGVEEQVHEDLSPEEQVHEDLSPEEQVHEDLSPSGNTGVEEQVHEDLSPSGNTGVEEQVHEDLSPEEQVHEDLSPEEQVHEDLSPEEQVHEDLSPSGNTGVEEQVHEDLSPEEQVHEDLSPEEQVHEDLSPEEQVHEDLSPSGNTGVEEQVLEDLSPSGDTGDELVGTREELHLSIGGPETRVTVEGLKPAMVAEEKLVKTSKENDSIVPDKVVPIGAKTGLMHPDHDQDDGWTLVNESKDQVQKDKETVCLQGNVPNCNAPAVTISSRQVNRSASENNFDRYDHSKLESSEPSEMVQAFDKKPLVNLENTACAQVNGQITNNVSTERCHAEVAIHPKAEDVIMTSPTVDKCVLFHSSNQEEQSPDFIWSGSSESGCFATPSEAKLHDDPQRTKRVAAVQPIPQNVSLGFKVHYITDTDSQVIAVIGDHEKLGEWESHVPLSSDKDGNWSHSLTLPADANVEWKFVVVENGKIKRWEECYNRHLRTAHEDLATQQWWGFP